MANQNETPDWDALSWINPPPHFEVNPAGQLAITTGEKTDFWQGTFYGFHRDDGHILGRPLPGAFTITVDFDGDYEALYDQAGLAIRASSTSWIKCGVEFTDGVKHLSVVVTNSNSDWSAIPIDTNGPVSVRATKLRDAFFIQYRLSEANEWKMARLAYLNKIENLIGGVMACSPQRAGFKARFFNFSISSPVISDIH